jgi:hypothetical protein
MRETEGTTPRRYASALIAVVEFMELLRERIKPLTRPLHMDGASRSGLNEAHFFVWSPNLGNLVHFPFSLCPYEM